MIGFDTKFEFGIYHLYVIRQRGKENIGFLTKCGLENNKKIKGNETEK